MKWSTKYEVLQPEESDSQKVFHPSVEYHFSSIDPASFGQATDASIEHAPSDSGSIDASEEIIDSVVATYIPPPQHVAGLEAQGPYCAWPGDTSSHTNAGRQQTLTYRDTTPPTWQGAESQEADNDVQVIPREQSNSPEEVIQWKSLLRNYYRINAPPVSRTLRNDSTFFVEHYFRDVCALYSSFDSHMNPFRSVISRLWDNSSSIFYAIQSMAAAHLANYMPGMSVQGLQMQRQAYECLQQELQLAHVNQQIDDKLLLTVLLLGMSSPWHEAGDLGMAHLNAARGLIYPRLLKTDGQQTEDMARNDQFFAEALIYWEMCIAFVHNEPLKPGQERSSDTTDYNKARTIGTQVMPHPWTGVGPRAQMIFAEVGRLVRHYRAMFAPISYGPTTERLSTGEIIAAAADYEEELLGIRWPALDDLADVQDHKTGKLDFIMVAEATRCSALLQIYRVFPNILHNRLLQIEGQANVGAAGASSQFFFPFCGRLLAPDSKSPTVWLTSLARHIVLDLIGAVPTSSGTRPLQLLMLVTAAAELRLSGPTSSSSRLTDTTAYNLDLARARGLAMARLEEMAARLPSKPVYTLIRLVQEVWRRYDLGEDVFWLDVMHENGWQTVMG